MTTTDTPTPESPPDRPQPGDTPDSADAFIAALDAAATPAGSVAGTDLSGLLRNAELVLDRTAEVHASDGDWSDERRCRQLSTIVDHVRRVEQSDSTHYIVEKSMMIVDAAVQLEFDARTQTARAAGTAELIDEAAEQLEALIRRVRPVVSGLAGGELHRDDIRALVERVEGLTRWVRQLEPMTTGSDD